MRNGSLPALATVQIATLCMGAEVKSTPKCVSDGTADGAFGPFQLLRPNDAKTGTCLVTVGAFNAALWAVEAENDLTVKIDAVAKEIERTRRSVMQQLLDDAFLTDKLRETGLENESLNLSPICAKLTWTAGT